MYLSASPAAPLGEGVAVADVGGLDAVEQHVHAADAEHGGVEVVAVEHRGVEVLALRRVEQSVGVSVADVFARSDEEAAGAARRVADLVGRPRCGHLDHQFDDVARRSELAVDTGRSDLGEQVLVQVPVGVAVGHRDVVEHVDDLGQERRGGDGEAGVLHVLAVGAAVAQAAQEREDLVGDGLVHHLGGGVLELTPPQMRLTWQEHRPVNLGLGDAGLLFGQRLDVVEAADEQ